VERWRQDSGPSEDRATAFYDWCLVVVGEGPPDDALPIPGEPDAYLASIDAAGVLVTFLAVEQDQPVFIRNEDLRGRPRSCRCAFVRPMLGECWVILSADLPFTNEPAGQPGSQRWDSGRAVRRSPKGRTLFPR
jgi:hypothetical protein